MKFIKLFTAQFLFCFVLALISCNEDQVDEPIAVKPQPENSREINILVDNSLDFTNYQAHTIMDSMAMDKPNEKLYGPQGFESILFFTDKSSGEITALVPLESEKSEVSVSVETVVTGVLTFAPLYTSLTKEQKIELGQRILSHDSYLKLKEVVEEILSNNEPIFSERPEFINQLIEVNSYIQTTFFPDNNPEGGRINLGKEDFPSFVSRDNGMTVYNQVSSYVYLKFIPKSGGDPISYVLQPNPFNPFSKSKVERSTLGLKDDCYEILINQNDAEVISKNRDELAKKMVSAILGVIFSDFSGNGINSCLIELSGTIALKLGTEIENSENQSQLEILIKTTMLAADLLILAVKEKKCNSLFFNTGAIAKLFASTSNLYVNLYKSANFTFEVSEASAFAFSLVPSMRIDLSENAQIYEGNLVEACVNVLKDVNLDSEYPAGENLTIKIKLDAHSQYAEWEKSGFKVSWTLPPLNGELSQLFTTTTEEGVGSVNWTLPNEANAVVTLTAEVKDKEGDHISGSPLVFQVKIKDGPEFGTFTDPRDDNVYKTVKIGTQTWFAENLRYAGSVSNISSEESWLAIWNSGNPTGQAAWAFYDNDPNNNTVYGKLYNWYAVKTGTLCPQGWHIPSDAEWFTLTNFLGPLAGGKMKSVTGWNQPNVDATNESGFSALPGGYRDVGGRFNGIGLSAHWWSSSPGFNGAFIRFLNRSNGVLNRGDDYTTPGFSCRCLKD